jgi:hydrogenase expression/formation protein HypC
MCMGIPMQVLDVTPGYARVRGRGEVKTVETALIDAPVAGDWLLVFLDSARERISAERAAEVDATLDLVAQAMAGLQGLPTPADPLGAAAPPGFELPSAMSADQLAALTGGRS